MTFEIERRVQTPLLGHGVKLAKRGNQLYRLFPPLVSAPDAIKAMPEYADQIRV